MDKLKQAVHKFEAKAGDHPNVSSDQSVNPTSGVQNVNSGQSEHSAPDIRTSMLMTFQIQGNQRHRIGSRQAKVLVSTRTDTGLAARPVQIPFLQEWRARRYEAVLYVQLR